MALVYPFLWFSQFLCPLSGLVQILQFLEENFPIKRNIKDIAEYLKVSFKIKNKSEEVPLDLFFNNIISLIEIGTILVSEKDRSELKRAKRTKMTAYITKVNGIQVLISAVGFQYLSQMRSEENAHQLKKLTAILLFANFLLLSAALMQIIYSALSNWSSLTNLWNLGGAVLFAAMASFIAYCVLIKA